MSTYAVKYPNVATRKKDVQARNPKPRGTFEMLNNTWKSARLEQKRKLRVLKVLCLEYCYMGQNRVRQHQQPSKTA